MGNSLSKQAEPCKPTAREPNFTVEGKCVSLNAEVMITKPKRWLLREIWEDVPQMSLGHNY